MTWLVIFVITFIVVIFMILYLILKYEKIGYDKFCEYVLVLGAKILDKDTPCKVLENRLLKAVDYLKKFKDSKVIVSGGKGIDEEVSEGYVMKKYLMKNGIDENRIFIEDSSTNTFENLKNTRNIIGNIDEILIITSKYHLLRSKILAKRVGFKKVYLIGSDVSKISRKRNLIREVFAIIKSIFLDW